MKKPSDIKTAYPYDTRVQEAKIMRALVAAGENGLSRSQLWSLVGSAYGWKLERALKRLLMFEKARREIIGHGHRRRRERWFALVVDDTMEHGLNPDWTIEVVGT